MKEKQNNSRLEDEFEPLRKFLEFYDYSFWYHKVKSLKLAIQNDEFINNVSKTFTVGGEPNKIKKDLATEIFFTCFHAIESLFFLIGGFTYSPKNPLEWINNPRQYVHEIAKIFKEKKFHKLYENLGFNSIDEYVSFLFYPIADEYKKEFKSSIEAVPQLLHLLGKEFFDKKEIYNSFKHGLLIFPGDFRIDKGNAKGEKTTLINSIPGFMVLPKDGKKKSKFFPETDRMEYSTKFMSEMDIYYLDYQRQLKIFTLTMALMRNLVQLRRDAMQRKMEGAVLNLPKLEEINEVFKESPLFTIEKIDDEEGNKNEI